jgi:uncharacterized protein with NRDE domain
MCLYVFAYNAHPLYRFVMAANRDEFYDRPTEKASFWPSDPQVLAGRDLKLGGTWMGITKMGRFAALTNYRDPSSYINHARSRGILVSNFLTRNITPQEYVSCVISCRESYNGFNLLTADAANIFYYNKHYSAARILEPGIYGLSNHYLDTPWFKVKKSKQAFADYLKDNDMIEPQALLAIMRDTEQAPDDELPDTGISREREKLLSSIFIQGDDYGTRSSAVLLIGYNNHVLFMEKSYGTEGQDSALVCYEFDLLVQ